VHTATVVSSPLAQRRRKLDDFLGKTVTRHRSTRCYKKNLGGEAGTVVLTGGAGGAVEEDGVDRETPLQWKKVLQNRLPSCTREH
jgi:hypothetical protein